MTDLQRKVEDMGNKLNDARESIPINMTLLRILCLIAEGLADLAATHGRGKQA